MSRRAPTRSSRPRVGIDASQIQVRGKGIARYLAELLPALARLEPPLDLVALVPPEAALPGGGSLERHDVRPRPATLWEQFGLPRAAREARLGLVHTTSDRLPVAPTVPIVVYLFEDPRHRDELMRGSRDTRHEIANMLTRVLFPLSLRRAALILVSSEATARDVRARGVSDDRVRLIYPGVSKSFEPVRDETELRAIREEFGCPDGFVLHFSSDDPRDNTPVVLEAYAEASRRRLSMPPLLVAGAAEATLPARREQVRRAGIEERVRWLGYLSDEAVRRLYRAASAYVDPSLFEGFGFQVAEALASGAPVICSNTSSLPELVGEAGVLLSPHDIPGFAEALVALEEDRERVARLREAAVRQARHFDWCRAAEETIAAWQELLAKAARA